MLKTGRLNPQINSGRTAKISSTFALVASLFLLWGFCNGMIDILNKHFQDALHINKEQSGLVQFANYPACFLMAKEFLKQNDSKTSAAFAAASRPDSP